MSFPSPFFFCLRAAAGRLTRCLPPLVTTSPVDLAFELCFKPADFTLDTPRDSAAPEAIALFRRSRLVVFVIVLRGCLERDRQGDKRSQREKRRDHTLKFRGLHKVLTANIHFVRLWGHTIPSAGPLKTGGTGDTAVGAELG